MNNNQIDVYNDIKKWAKKNNMDAAVWTALMPNFEEQTGKCFKVENAIKYLKSLPKSAKKNALNYIKRAPRKVITPLRDEIRKLRYLR